MKRVAFWVGLALIPLGFAVPAVAVFVARPAPVLCHEAPGTGWERAHRMVPVPYTGAHFCPGVRSAEVDTNDLGYRGRVDFAAQARHAEAIRARGGRTVVLLGGSAAFGWRSVGEDMTIAGQLTAMLRAAGHDARVFNLGMGYYGSGQELAAAVHYGAALAPAVYVTFGGFNDLLRAFHRNHGGPPLAPFFYAEARQLHPVKFASAALDERSAGAEGAARAVAEYRANVGRLAAFARGSGARLVVAAQPVRGFRNACAEGDGAPGYTDALVAAYGGIADHDAPPGAAWAASAAAFSGWGSDCGAFLDVVHLTARGQAEVARRLLPAIVKGWL